jgi:nucleoid-associated protein YgaU
VGLFLDSSRYRDVRKTQAVTKDGRVVNVVALRRLPQVESEPAVVRGGDRLDLMAESLYDDGTRFWRIADANSELQANDLVKLAGREIEVPKR